MIFLYKLSTVLMEIEKFCGENLHHENKLSFLKIACRKIMDCILWIGKRVLQRIYQDLFTESTAALTPAGKNTLSYSLHLVCLNCFLEKITKENLRPSNTSHMETYTDDSSGMFTEAIGSVFKTEEKFG
jgi:hypothetical protein